MGGIHRDTDSYFFFFSFFFKIRKGGLWDHLVVCVCIHLCLSICLYCPLIFWGLWGHLAVCVSPLIFEAYETNLLSVSLQVFVRRVMRSPCCLCVPCPLIFFVLYAICIVSGKIGSSTHNF
jgi:hypothetical protein